MISQLSAQMILGTLVNPSNHMRVYMRDGAVNICTVKPSSGRTEQHLEGQRIPESSRRTIVECLNSNCTDSELISQVWRGRKLYSLSAWYPVLIITMLLGNWIRFDLIRMRWKKKCLIENILKNGNHSSTDAWQVKSLDTSVRSSLFLLLINAEFMWSK